MVATSWSRLGAFRIQPELDLRKPALNWTGAVTFASMADRRQGFMKALVGDSHDRILGFAMIGAAAGEVMAAVQTAMLAGLSNSTLADADFAHPTMAEGLSSLFSSVPPRVVQQTKSKVA